MTKFYIALTMILCTMTMYSHAQRDTKTVTGKVTDQNGVPVIGASIVLKTDTKTGVSSNNKGEYSIALPKSGSSVLVVSFIGMLTQEINVPAAKSVVDITLKESANDINQVIVTGYAQTTKKMVTGSVGVIGSDVFTNKPQTSIDALMQGQLAGVVVSNTSGQPGRSASIIIRGRNTMTLGQQKQPLWVVDGVPLQGTMPNVSESELSAGGFDNLFVNGIGNINPNDIDNTTVLKDAAAAAIYGSRAANGVIVVTTKRGKVGDMKVSYGANLSVTFMPQRDAGLMNSSEKIAWEQELWDEFSANRYATDQVYPAVGIVGMVRSGYGRFASMRGNKAAQDAFLGELANTNTDWYKELFRNALATNQHVSISGGTEKYNYYVSLGYSYTGGMLKNDNYNRTNINSNFTFTPNKVIKIDLGIDIAQQRSKSPNLLETDPFKYAYYANPYETSYNEDGSYRADETYYSIGHVNGETKTPLFKRGFNLMREINETSSENKNWSNTVRLGMDFNLLRNLKLSTLASYSFSNRKGENINLKDTYAAFQNRMEQDKNKSEPTYSGITQNSINGNNYMARAHFMFVDNFGSAHALTMIAGAEIRGTDSESMFTKRFNYDPNTGTTSMPPLNGSQSSYESSVEKLSGEYFSKDRYASFYASADYSLLNRYIANFTIRTDGASNFGSDRQFNPTWSAGIAWHMMEEEFMAPLKGIFSRFSLRAATGFAGNVNNGVSPQLVMSYRDQEYRKYDGNSLPLGMIAGAPNPNLAWEKTQDFKAGLDIGMFDDRISAAVEVYMRKSKDVVETSRIPSSVGFTSLKFNSVDIENRGLEATLSGKIVRSKTFNLNASVNFAYNGNKITRYTPYLNYITQQDRFWQGYPIGSLFSGRPRGVDRYDGLYEYELRPDAQINSSSDLQDARNYQFYLGTTYAPYTGGFYVNASYKSFSLSVSGSYSLGSKVVEQTKSPTEYGSISSARTDITRTSVQSQYSDLYSNHLNVKRDRTDRWTAANPTGTKYPRIYDAYGEYYEFGYYHPMESNIVYGAFVQENSYMKIRNIVLSYKLPVSFVNKAGISDVTFNMSLNNFFTFTKYTGVDPEIPGATYPTSRSMTFGVNVAF